MKESSIEKEVKIVESEYQMGITDDMRRVQHLVLHLSKLDHPIRGVFSGTY